MVKVTGRTRDGGHLRRHLDYIGRNGAVRLEGPDGEILADRSAFRALAEAWAEEQAVQPGRRRDTPLSHSIVLSMPRGTPPDRLEDAARAFAQAVFADRFDYAFAVHDEGKHPHVHLTVRSLGREGQRLNPRKADLQAWREAFAGQLRARGVEAEATPRRVRGVVRKAERTPVRKMRERFSSGGGKPSRVLDGAVRDALANRGEATPWRVAIVERQRLIRRSLLAEAVRLAAAETEEDRRLGRALQQFVRERPPVETQAEVIRRTAARSRPSPERGR